jgi:hypothetical protein
VIEVYLTTRKEDFRPVEGLVAFWPFAVDCPDPLKSRGGSGGFILRILGLKNHALSIFLSINAQYCFWGEIDVYRDAAESGRECYEFIAHVKVVDSTWRNIEDYPPISYMILGNLSIEIINIDNDTRSAMIIEDPFVACSE